MLVLPSLIKILHFVFDIFLTICGMGESNLTSRLIIQTLYKSSYTYFRILFLFLIFLPLPSFSFLFIFLYFLMF